VSTGRFKRNIWRTRELGKAAPVESADGKALHSLSIPRFPVWRSFRPATSGAAGAFPFSNSFPRLTEVRQSASRFWLTSYEPRFWLKYHKPSGHQLFGVIILDSQHLTDARMRAAVEGIDQGTDFAEGHELDPETSALAPATAMGRMLSQEESAVLIRRLESEIPKRGRRPRRHVW